MDQHATGTRYAILIGINNYPDSPLKGCVRDVQEIKKCLEKMPNPVHIKRFTASLANDSYDSPLTENTELWPTHGNVTSILKMTTTAAKPGDFVYIHYSGHGTSDECAKNLSLVLLETTGKTVIRYLKGLELAHLLRDLVEKEVTVTLVLDCCFPGSVVRKDSLARFMCYDPAIDTAYPSNFDQNLSSEAETSHSAYRSASMRPNWLVNPDGYTILIACGPTEIAKELILDKNGYRHGALSYFLLRAFAKLGGVWGNQQQIYHQLCARFRESRGRRNNEQNPIFFGNKRFCFFGRASLKKHITSIPIIKNVDGSIQLEAGQAHGICDGDQFAICPLSSEDRSTSSYEPTIATATQVGALSSQIQPLRLSSFHIETGWIATPLTSLALRNLPIRLESNSPIPDQLRMALQERQSLEVYDDRNANLDHSFSLIVDSENSCQIRDENDQQIIHVPTATQHEEEAAHHVIHVIEHLTKFKLVRNLTNILLADPAYPFRESFAVQLIATAGKVFQPGCLQRDWFTPGRYHAACVVEVKDGENLELVVENKMKNNNLHPHLYSLGHCWEIEDILCGNHEVIPYQKPNQNGAEVWTKKIKMNVPHNIEKKAQPNCEDTNSF